VTREGSVRDREEQAYWAPQALEGWHLRLGAAKRVASAGQREGSRSERCRVNKRGKQMSNMDISERS
jgi:hypothetical protein